VDTHAHTHVVAVVAVVRLADRPPPQEQASDAPGIRVNKVPFSKRGNEIGRKEKMFLEEEEESGLDPRELGEKGRRRRRTGRSARRRPRSSKGRRRQFINAGCGGV